MSEIKPSAEIPNDLSLRLRDLDSEMLYTLSDYVKALADARTEADDRDNGKTDDGFEMDVTVPWNVTGTIRVPDPGADSASLSNSMAGVFSNPGHIF